MRIIIVICEYKLCVCSIIKLCSFSEVFLGECGVKLHNEWSRESRNSYKKYKRK